MKETAHILLHFFVAEMSFHTFCKTLYALELEAHTQENSEHNMD